MNEADKRNIEKWRALKGRTEPWLASGNMVYVAHQVVLHYPDKDIPCFRSDGKESMEADHKRIIGVCEDYGEAAGIANRHNAAIGHWLFDDWLESEIQRAEAADGIKS
jgi:hypothetical protein